MLGYPIVDQHTLRDALRYPSSLHLQSWPTLKRKCASPTSFRKRWIPGALLVRFQCRQFVRVEDLRGYGKIKVSNPKYNFLYPLWSLSQLGSTVSVQLCLDFRKNSVLEQNWLKNQTSSFSNKYQRPETRSNLTSNA